MTAQTGSKKLGELNGKWLGLVKFAAVFLPSVATIMLAMLGWALLEIVDIQKWRAGTDANRFTVHDWNQARDKIDERFDNLPPPDWRERISNAEHEARRLDTRLDEALLKLDERLDKMAETLVRIESAVGQQQGAP